jgi:phosphoenolpyruvate-protein phosphotransferase (PTS system enzyme I)
MIERRLVGLGVSKGFAIGPLIFLKCERSKVAEVRLDPQHKDTEIQRLREAAAAAQSSLKALTSTDLSIKNPIPGLLEVQSLILSSLENEAVEMIRQKFVNAEWALQTIVTQQVSRQRTMEDPAFRDKYIDIEDAARRMLEALDGGSVETNIERGSIVYTSDLRPSVAIDLLRFQPSAFITERGGWTSHCSILAREFHVPMVSGIRLWEKGINNGDTVLVDGSAGEVVLHPRSSTLLETREAMNITPLDAKSGALASGPTVTSDGVVISIKANVATTAAYEIAERSGALGIGLYRSEVLINRAGIIPSEREQLSAYLEIARATSEYGVNIRTFDVDSDVLQPSSAAERNPALGVRSIRSSLLNTKHFRLQLRCLVRASAEHRVNIILPMVSRMDEVYIARQILEEERSALIAAGLSAGSPQIGCMIEVPSSVVIADKIARSVDFLCLGTNDLVQYLLAVDRDNGAAADFYETLNPAVLSSIRQVIAQADVAGRPTIVCGEVAGSPFYIPLLLGLGARHLSLNVNSIHAVRKVIAGVNASEARSLADYLVSLNTAREVETELRTYYLREWPDLFPDGLLEASHR